MEKTTLQYDRVIEKCRDIFEKKTKDYGTAWRILRPSSLTDQLYIKASRIRSIEELGAAQAKVDDPILLEYVGLINYSIMALIQLDHQDMDNLDVSLDQVLTWFDTYSQGTKELMEAKNHDYGEAWRDMRVSSITDLVLMKLLRIKSIEENDGKTIISEGLDANYMDIINYAVFAMILLEDKN